MSWHIVRLADAKPQLWKNRGGLTRELLAWPSAADWRIRLSVADITADGPFSTYDGVQRWFAVLDGDGVCLTVDGAATQLRRSSSAFGFAGAAQTSCALLGGPTRDFNLMLRGATGRLQRIRKKISSNLDDFLSKNDMVFIACCAINTGAIVRFDQETFLLEPDTLAWRLVNARTAVRGADWSVQASDALWMEIAA